MRQLVRITLFIAVFLLAALAGCAGHVPGCTSDVDCQQGLSCVKWQCVGGSSGGGTQPMDAGGRGGGFGGGGAFDDGGSGGGFGVGGGLGGGGGSNGGGGGSNGGSNGGGVGGGGGGGGGGPCGPATCNGCCRGPGPGQCFGAPDNGLDSTCGNQGTACTDCRVTGLVCYAWDRYFCADPPRHVSVSAAWVSSNGGGRGPQAVPSASVFQGGQWNGGALIVPRDGGGFDVSVPMGDVLIGASGNFVYGSSNNVSFDVPGWGRATQQPVDGGSAQVTLTGLSPTFADDGFSFSSLASGSQFGGSYTNLSPGMTALNANVWPIASWGPLLTWNAGDDLTILQFQTAPGAPPLRSTAASAITVAPSFVNGGVTTVSSALTTGTRSASLSWGQSLSPYLMTVPLTNPNAVSDGSYYAVISLPGDNLVAANSQYSDLTLRLSEVSQRVPDAPTFSRTMNYQSLRRPLIFYAHARHIMIAAPPAPPVPFSVFGQSWVDDRVQPFSWPGGVVNRPPALAPVQNLRINGMDASNGVNMMGVTPMVSWQPAIRPPLFFQAPTGYVLSVYSVENVAGTTSARLVAAISTTRTSLPIPQGIVTGPYLLTVKAELDPGPMTYFDRSSLFWGNNVTRSEFSMAITAVNQP